MVEGSGLPSGSIDKQARTEGAKDWAKLVAESQTARRRALADGDIASFAHRLFLQGGNWIFPDQFRRFAGNASRSYAEVRLHQQMGFNLIRVWGGGGAERPEFFAACDALGVFVMQ